MIVTIIVVSILLMAVFFAVTIAGGRSHDRANEIAARGARKLIDQKGEGQEQEDA